MSYILSGAWSTPFLMKKFFMPPGQLVTCVNSFLYSYLCRNYCIIDLGKGTKGTVAWDGFLAHCILSRIEKKDLQFFHIVLIFTGLEQDLTHLAHKENTHSEFFLLGRPTILSAFCSLRALIWDAISHGWKYCSWKILSHSPNTLKETKIRQKEKIKIFILYLGYIDMVKKPSHATLSL